jgi:hypothetical protein
MYIGMTYGLVDLQMGMYMKMHALSQNVFEARQPPCIYVCMIVCMYYICLYECMLIAEIFVL